ncbi:type II toxin-antitoxin system VapC family toxin [Chelatococcus sp. SYSU_G07232]|uniref:Type II toxin-antitoxin system VapC family toxin n=1 Tax=Chelatococcus albus TaxID=3047466 RepID=A0ABT7AEH6_9HYPH|nr:type II toxin-antitoxin system VapC family toxin [Chelatococcus sp. SYSU_G07232]MDJ1157772.1 type II toxin-antitoxin system VapC family toxin [Chelatococcus sp. SYSU_G07232]
MRLLPCTPILPTGTSDTLTETLARSSLLVVSAFTLFEIHTVIWPAKEPALLDDLARLLDGFPFETAPFDTAQAEIAVAAYKRFGKDTGHPARLNLGDCASYALAMSLDAPLLYKGNDFSQTDVRSALTA